VDLYTAIIVKNR